VLRGLDAGEDAQASALAREAGVTRQAIGQVIAELEQLDIVEQIPDPGDARAKRSKASGQAASPRSNKTFRDSRASDRRNQSEAGS
jgi:hypothetical protein